jgi:hypothetical protein
MIDSKQISKLENFIKNNKSGHLSLTYNNIYELKKIYDKIKDNPIGSYCIFACESFYSYALYKSINGSFYVVSVFMQDVKEYEEFPFIMDRFNL